MQALQLRLPSGPSPGPQVPPQPSIPSCCHAPRGKVRSDHILRAGRLQEPRLKSQMTSTFHIRGFYLCRSCFMERVQRCILSSEAAARTVQVATGLQRWRPPAPIAKPAVPDKQFFPP